MGFVLRVWRRIGAKLYLALGFAVVLTVVSSAVGVYYFEESGDANYQLRTESAPALEAAWGASREGERLQGLGALAMTTEIPEGSVGESLARLEENLSRVTIAPGLAQQASQSQDLAYQVAGVVDNLAVTRGATVEADAEAAQLLSDLAASGDTAGISTAAAMLAANSQSELDGLWQQFSQSTSLDAGLAETGSRAFEVRAQQLALMERTGELAADLESSSEALEVALSGMLAAAQNNSTASLESSVTSFDQGRVLLAAISLISVAVATVAAWLLVGNGLVRPLTRLSERMRGMAGGDLETPVPGVGRDEIGELAEALEVFRQQALEVQRLNLVEKLYGELQEANAELQRMQDRLVAQEKLAALGELVSGVAHEISNPLNFVQNFAEVSVEMYEELTGVLGSYEDSMSEEDRTAIHDLEEDLADSLARIRTNGGRALAIVERMRGLGVVGGELTPVDLNSALHGAVDVGTSAFIAQWPEFEVSVEFDLDESIGEVPLVEGDFGEAVVNLVSNACYAMWLKESEKGEADYQPMLKISSAAKGAEVEIRVRDNGTGISEDVLGHIFNPFFSTREGALGAGLGLPIAADVARRAGGNLTVDTVVGEFAEFSISLPASTVGAGEVEVGESA
ncbi:MAG: ATP-binding protein [Chloroflexi bacterium]|nr:ATP-binding protein [Chloroflexota bacterium]